MNFNEHYNLEGKHAFLGASQNSWLRKNDDEIVEAYKNAQAKELGTRLHALAAEHINLGIKMPRNSVTLNNYINDAIGYRMSPERVLYYSDLCFGTADAISFSKNFLRIHDLKTGKTPVHMEQLLIYMALFCLEYGIKPGQLDGAELSIYQNDDIWKVEPHPEDVVPIMDKIVHYNAILQKMRKEEA